MNLWYYKSKINSLKINTGRLLLFYKTLVLNITYMMKMMIILSLVFFGIYLKFLVFLIISVNMCGMSMWVQCPSEENLGSMVLELQLKLSCLLCMLGMELSSSARDANTLNCWVISPVPHLQQQFIQTSKVCFYEIGNLSGNSQTIISLVIFLLNIYIDNVNKIVTYYILQYSKVGWPWFPF